MSRFWLIPLVTIALLIGPAAPALATEEELDEAGRLVRSVDDDGVVVLYRYDEEGRVVDVQRIDQPSAPGEPIAEPVEQ